MDDLDQHRRREVRYSMSGSTSSLTFDPDASSGTQGPQEVQPLFRHQRRSSHTLEAPQARRITQALSHGHESPEPLAGSQQLPLPHSKEDINVSSQLSGDADTSFSVVGAIPASRVTTHALPVRVTVHVASNESKKTFKGMRSSKLPPDPSRVRDDFLGDQIGSNEKRNFDTSNIKVKFWNHETEIVVDGQWKGRCRENEIYGVSKKREILKNAQIAPSDKSGFVPFNTLCKAQKMQALYSKEELQEAGLFNCAFIQKIAFKMSDCPDRSLESFRLSYAWIQDNMLTEFRETEVCYGPVNLNQNIFVTNEWLWFTLAIPIQWDGNSNLVVEISKDESHASFSWPATGGLVLKNTPNICAVAHKDNNDSSGAYPFSNWKNPTRFRKVPAMAIEVSAPPSNKIVCTCPLSKFGSGLISVEVAMDGRKFTKDRAVFVYRAGKPVATNNLVRDLRQLLESGIPRFSDVKFTVKDSHAEEVFKAHQVVLAARSPVFRGLFAKQQKGNPKQTQEIAIQIDDIRPTVFRCLLTFLYSGSVELNIDTACELFKAADVYEVDDLKKSCEEFLKQNTTIESVTSLLLAAENLRVPVIRSYYLDFLLWHFDAVSKTDAFAKHLVPKHELMREIFISRRKFLDRHPTKEKHSQFTVPKSKDLVRDRTNVTFVSSLISDLEKLLVKPTEFSDDMGGFFDVKFHVGHEFGQTKYFFAHKVILSSRCDVFGGMFRSEMKESAVGFVEVPNIRPIVFESILQYLYTAKAHIEFDTVFELYRAADQYVLEELKQCCEEFVIQELTIDNVALFLIEADKWNVASVRSFCVDLGVSEFDEVSITEGFLEKIIPRADLLTEILRSRTSDS